MTRTFASLSLCLLLSACFGQTRPYTANLTAQVENPGLPSLGAPLDKELLVVLEAEDAYTIKNIPDGVRGFVPFFTESLKQSLGSMFAKITFVEPGFQAPATPHVLARVHVEPIYAKNIISGEGTEKRRDFLGEEHDVAVTYTTSILHMPWTFTIRKSDQEQDVFSFSQTAKSKDAYQSLDMGCHQVMNAAMTSLLQDWKTQDVTAKLGGQEISPPPANTGKKAVLALFDIQDASKSLKADTLSQLSLYLGTLLVQQGKFNVVPREQLRSRLKNEKKGGYRQCVDSSCRIELGKALAAEKTLSVTLIKMGGKCVFTATLFDLKTETAQQGASVEGKCEEEALLTAMKAIASQL